MKESANYHKLRKGLRALRLELEELADAIAADRVSELSNDQPLPLIIKPAHDFFDEITQNDHLPDDENLYGKVLLLITDLGYASTIVLSFDQMESLLGRRLPPIARTERDWWTGTVLTADRHSQAWTAALRTATPNLSARNVTFERP